MVRPALRESAAMRTHRLIALPLAVSLIALAGCPRREGQPAPGSVGLLAAASGEVAHRPAAAATWEAASKGLRRFPLDGLRTGRLASARVTLTRSKTQFELDEQSLVVIAPPLAPAATAGSSGLGPRPAVAEPLARLEQGTLRGVSQPAEPALHVLLPDGRALRIAAEKKAPAPFRLRVREGGKVEVAVIKGLAQVSLPGGSPVRLAMYEAAEVSRSIGEAQPLPDFPQPLSPSTNAQVQAGVSVPLRWQYISRASGYRVQVSESTAFDRCIIDQTVKVPEMDLAGSAAGKTYYWRMRSFDASGRESEFSPARRLSVVTTPATRPATRPADKKK